MKWRLLLAAVVVAMVAVLIWQWVTLPEQVPAKLGFGGTVQRWGSKSEFLLTMSGATVLMALVFGTVEVWLRRIPAAFVNVPHPQYWLVPQRRAELARMRPGSLRRP